MNPSRFTGKALTAVLVDAVSLLLEAGVVLSERLELRYERDGRGGLVSIRRKHLLELGRQVRYVDLRLLPRRLGVGLTLLGSRPVFRLIFLCTLLDLLQLGLPSGSSSRVGRCLLAVEHDVAAARRDAKVPEQQPLGAALVEGFGHLVEQGVDVVGAVQFAHVDVGCLSVRRDMRGKRKQV